MRSCLLRHKSDTIDLLEACFSVIDQPHGGFPERCRAGSTSGFFLLSCRSAGDDQLAQLVVEDEQFPNCLSSFETGAAALRAAPPAFLFETGGAIGPHE